MGLFDPIWMTGKSKQIPKAIAAVNKMDDPGKLREVALHANFADIKLAACARIDDQNTLAEVAKAGDLSVAQGLLTRLAGRDDLLKAVALRYASNSALVVKAIDAMSSPQATDLKELRLAVMQSYFGYDIVRGRTKTYSDLTPMERQSYEEAKTQVSKAIGRVTAKVTDSEKIFQAVKTLCDHGWLLPNYSQLLDALTPAQLDSLAQNTDVNADVRRCACAKAGHQLNAQCACTRCGKTSAHRFEGKTCANCGARRVVEIEELTGSTMGSDPIVYGRIERTYLVYKDGSRTLEHEERSIDKGTWNYLYG